MGWVKEAKRKFWEVRKEKNGKQNSIDRNIDGGIYSVSGISGVHSGGNSDS